MEKEWSAVKCEICGKEANMTFVIGQEGEKKRYCMDCHNRKVAEMMGRQAPEKPPKVLMAVDPSGTVHAFRVEHMLMPHCQTLIAEEDGETQYRSEVYAEPETEVSEMWKTLVRRIGKLLSARYLKKDGSWSGSKICGVIGYSRETGDLEFVVDGKPYSFRQLRRELRERAGFQFKLELGDPTDTRFE